VATQTDAGCEHENEDEWFDCDDQPLVAAECHVDGIAAVQPAPEAPKPGHELVDGVYVPRAELIGEFKRWLYLRSALMERTPGYMKMMPGLMRQWCKGKKIEVPSTSLLDALLLVVAKRLEPSKAELKIPDHYEDPWARALMNRFNEAMRCRLTTVRKTTAMIIGEATLEGWRNIGNRMYGRIDSWLTRYGLGSNWVEQLGLAALKNPNGFMAQTLPVEPMLLGSGNV
jgi:hypothetical protein